MDILALSCSLFLHSDRWSEHSVQVNGITAEVLMNMVIDASTKVE